MGISDLYIIRYLLQGTRAGGRSILWEEKESDAYVANVRGVQIELACLSSSTGSRLCLTLSCRPESVRIEEPRSVGVFRRRYETEDEQQLAEQMNLLALAIDQHCEARRNWTTAAAESTRDSIYRRLLFGEPEVPVEAE
jgi:hypothetical protein